MSAKDHFKKQRTKLISMSIVLWLYEGLGLSWEKISILGNDIVITYPSVLRIGIWFAGFYWFFRFNQFYLALKSEVAFLEYTTYFFWK